MLLKQAHPNMHMYVVKHAAWADVVRADASVCIVYAYGASDAPRGASERLAAHWALAGGRAGRAREPAVDARRVEAIRARRAAHGSSAARLRAEWHPLCLRIDA